MNDTYKVILSEDSLYITAEDIQDAAFTAKGISESLAQDLIDIIPMSNKRIKKYFPNRWKAFKDLDEEHIICHPFDEMMEYKSTTSIVESYYAVLRLKDITTGKVKEKSYKSKRYALKALTESVMSMQYEVTFINDYESAQFNPLTDVNHESFYTDELDG